MSTLLNNTDRYLLALMLWREARGQSNEARRAIASVVFNRIKAGRFGSTIEEVVLRPWAFSSFNAGDANALKYPMRKDRPDWTAWEDCCRVAEAASADGDDPSKGSTHYHSYPQGHALWPKWATPDKLAVRIGPFWFYRDVR